MSTARLRRSCSANRCSRIALPARIRHRPNANQAGFALVAVIWSLGLITLLGTAVIVGARYRTKMTSSLAAVTAASGAAEGAVNLGIMTALTARSGQTPKFPLHCRMPGGERVIVTLEQEVGKVDLNAATPAVLGRLFTALTFDQSSGTRIAGRIVAFRESADKAPKDADPRATDSNPGNTANIGFTTITQLDRIEGISPRLFRTALRFVTVRSGRPEPASEAASPALRAALGLDQNITGPAANAPATGEVTIRADVRAADGTRFIREALVSLATNGRPYLIREWRHGDIGPDARGSTTRDREDTESRENGCLRTSDAVGT